MARIAPNPGQKIIYFVLILLSSVILFIDIKTEYFNSIKNAYKTAQIYSIYLSKELTIEPILSIAKITKTKKNLIEENNQLREALDLSYLNNFLLSNESAIYKDKDLIENSLQNLNYKDKYFLAELKSINPNIYLCCDKHRLFIEILSNQNIDHSEFVVFNHTGLLGYVISSGKYNEVILITDINHSFPIKSESGNFFCNGKGSGRGKIIICSFNPLINEKEFQLGENFYSSGLGGIYPKDIKVGKIVKINYVDQSRTDIEIETFANPLSSDLFGAFKY